MNRLTLSFITASALIFGVFLPKEVAARTTAKDLLGTWTLVSVTVEQDGKKSDFFGPNPRGQVTFAPNGRMSFIITVPIEGTTFPNWIGTDQKRPFTISGGELKWTTPTTSLGSGTALDVWRRAK
jgi:Lipocalin-like domain